MNRTEYFYKSGISLIAVLMFMLAATTASVVLFRWIDSENFASGSRLKTSEAYQASESGLDAVRGWLSNRPADVGALIRRYESEKLPIFLTDDSEGNVNLLGALGASRNQKYNVYLTGVDLNSGYIKMKFISIGEARDGSKVSQTAIFSVNGLYKVNISAPKPECTGDFEQAFFGGFKTNTQGKFSSAIIIGDMTINGFTSNKGLLVAGNLSTMDNGDRKIGCPANANEEPGDLYVTGDFNVRAFEICGDAYIGGVLKTQSGPVFRKSLYAAGGMQKISPLTIDGHLTLCDTLFTMNNDGMTVGGNLIMENIDLPAEYRDENCTGYGTIKFSDDAFANSPLIVGGSVWTITNFGGNKRQDRANNVRFGMSPDLYPQIFVPNAFNVSGNVWRNRKIINETNIDVHFASYAYGPIITPTLSNKPDSANSAKYLKYMSDRVEKDCQRANGRVDPYCVPDPLVLPAEIKARWLAAAEELDRMANTAEDTARLKSISNSCLRLLKKNNSRQEHDIQGKWLGCGNGSQSKFTEYVNQCYEDLRVYNNGSLLYNEGGKQFLAVNMDGTCAGDPRDVLQNNLIFIFKENVSSNIKLGETAPNAAVFIYLVKGATGVMAFTGSRGDGKSRNYFIYSEEDIAGASGSTTISGTIYLANGAKSGAITDTDVNFNKALFEMLLSAGIVSDGGSCDAEDGGIKDVADVRWIPVSNRLNVNLESKQISSGKDPAASEFGNLPKSILVMPRLVRISRNEFSDINDLSKYYSFIYLNGATAIDTSTSLPNCTDLVTGAALGIPPFTDGLYKCVFSDTTTTEFYIRAIGDKGDATIEFLPSGTLEIPSSEANGCRDVSIKANRVGTSDYTIKVVQHTGFHWNVTPETGVCTGSSPWICTIKTTDNPPVVKAFSVCEPSVDDDGATLEITECTSDNCRIKNSDSRVVITKHTEYENIKRNATCQNSDAWKACPPVLAEEWVTVSPVRSTIFPNDEWMAVLNNNITWTAIAPAHGACELNITCGNPVSSPQTGSFTLTETSKSFAINLKWKTATLTVNGGNYSLRMRQYSDSQIPLDFECTGSCTIFQGIDYVINSTNGNEYAWSCSNANYCQNTTSGYDNILIENPEANAHRVNVKGNVTVNLETRPIEPESSSSAESSSSSEPSSSSVASSSSSEPSSSSSSEESNVIDVDFSMNGNSCKWVALTPGIYKITAITSSGSCPGALRCKGGILTAETIVGKYDENLDMKVGTYGNPGPNINAAVGKTFIINDPIPVNISTLQCGYAY